jgi:hypothetical protein
MAIDKRLISATIGSFPLDTGTDPKLVSQGVTKLENVSYRRRGAIGHANGTNEVHNTNVVGGNITSFKGRALLWKQGDQRLWDG